MALRGILWSMLPQILLAADMDEKTIWRFSSLVFLTMMLAFAVYRIHQARSAADNINFAGPVFSIAASTQMAILGLNVYFANAQLFMLALLTNLCIGVYIFSLLLRGIMDG